MLTMARDKALGFLAERAAAVTPVAGERGLIALAGPPASGKSSVAAELVDRLNVLGRGAILVPMDGFHLDDRILRQRDLLPRKGAPETFDAMGFIHAMRRLREGAEVVLPEFDRTREIAVAGAIAVEERHRLAVVEGNYLCLDEPPWRELSGLWHLGVYLDVPEPVLERRLTERWAGHGLSSAETLRKVQDNDLRNARRIGAAMGKCDVVLRIEDEVGG